MIADVVNLQLLSFMWGKTGCWFIQDAWRWFCCHRCLGFDWLGFVISCMLTMRVTLWLGGQIVQILPRFISIKIHRSVCFLLCSSSFLPRVVQPALSLSPGSDRQANRWTPTRSLQSNLARRTNQPTLKSQYKGLSLSLSIASLALTHYFFLFVMTLVIWSLTASVLIHILKILPTYYPQICFVSK